MLLRVYQQRYTRHDNSYKYYNNVLEYLIITSNLIHLLVSKTKRAKCGLITTSQYMPEKCMHGILFFKFSNIFIVGCHIFIDN